MCGAGQADLRQSTMNLSQLQYFKVLAQGFGIAVMPDIPILWSLSVKTLDIYNPPYERAVYLATLKQRYLSPVSKAFIRFVIEETA